MDDLIPLIWVLVAVGAIIYNATTKKGKKQGHTAPTQGEAWPTAAEWPQVSQRHTESHPVTTHRKATKHPRQAPAKVSPGISAVDTTKREETPENEQPTVEPQDEAFDLRRAVIYSEILKPKFDE